MHKITVYGSGAAVDSAVAAFERAIAKIEGARTHVERGELLVGSSWSVEDIRESLYGRLGEDAVVTDAVCLAILREIGERIAELANERGNAAMDDLITTEMLAKYGLAD